MGMRFIPHSEQDVSSMLALVGVKTVAELFAHLPEKLRASAAIALPPGLSEHGVQARLTELADANRQLTSFLGAGAYAHFVPAVVDYVIQRAEFATAYTPYQPEVSQGTLQASFEFQSLVAALLGMEVANASLYDGASAVAEAVLMSKRILPARSLALIARSVHPHYRQTIDTYLTGFPGIRVAELAWGPDGRLDLKRLTDALDDSVCCVVVGYPNVFGVVEDLAHISELVRQAGTLLVSATCEPVALGLLKSPGQCGVDIAVAEGQSLGLPLSYGGPGLGLFACRRRFLRNMPGRVVGQTVDAQGRRGFVLTLATREQHIRRERATSNICTNHSLCALAATVFLCLVGKHGLRALAERNVKTSHYARELLLDRGPSTPQFSAPFFNEFVVRVPQAAATWRRLRDDGMLAGFRLEGWYPELRDTLLLCVTEQHTREQIERLARALAK